MRKLIAALVVVALAWTGWWYAGSGIATRALSVAIDARGEAAEITREGFPLRLAAAARDVTLADGTSVPLIQLGAPVHRPQSVRATLSSPIIVPTPQGPFTLAFDASHARTDVALGTGLTLEAAEGVTQSLRLDLAEARLLSARTVTATATRQDSARYGFTLATDGLAPGGAVRQTLRLAPDFPDAFERLRAAGDVAFDRPLDRDALAIPPRVVRIDLTDAQAVWGPLSLELTAALDVDPQGIATGQIHLSARNWREMLDLAERSGGLPAETRQQIEAVLGALTGGTDTLDVPITVQRGLMRVGFIPLGRLPAFPAP